MQCNGYIAPAYGICGGTDQETGGVGYGPGEELDNEWGAGTLGGLDKSKDLLDVISNGSDDAVASFFCSCENLVAFVAGFPIRWWSHLAGYDGNYERNIRVSPTIWKVSVVITTASSDFLNCLDCWWIVSIIVQYAHCRCIVPQVSGAWPRDERLARGIQSYAIFDFDRSQNIVT